MKYKTDGSRIAWLSIRLPSSLSNYYSAKGEDHDRLMLNSIYGTKEILSIAIADLALPKVGLDSLVLFASPLITFRTDFLNRVRILCDNIHDYNFNDASFVLFQVRMNTIQGYQIYSPIGFMLYPCSFAKFCKDCESCDVSQSSGYFDKWNFDVTSFYSRDYVQGKTITIIDTFMTQFENVSITINPFYSIVIEPNYPFHIKIIYKYLFTFLFLQ